MRTDCTRDNRATRLPNASHLGFDLWTAKRGNFVQYDPGAGNAGAFGRVLGRVHCEGKTYVEIIALLGALDCPSVRWIAPESILRCCEVPPRRILEWICGPWNNPADILARVERGFLDDSYLDSKEREAVTKD